MVPFTNTPFNVVTVTGADVGLEFALNTPRDGDEVSFVYSFSAGTGTIVIEGRNSPDDDWLQLDTAAADKQVTVKRFNYYRVGRSAATGLTAKVSSSLPLRQIVNGNFI